MNTIVLTHDLLTLLMPNATDRNIGKFCTPLNEAMLEYKINTSLRIAAFLAQVEVESGSLKYVMELADGSAYEYRADLGNLLPEALLAAHSNYSTTGKFYKGHGLIQITGFTNHKKCGEALGLPLVTNPTLLCEPVNAARSAAWFFNSHGCCDLADVKLFNKITKVINGGYNNALERTNAYSRNKMILNA